MVEDTPLAETTEPADDEKRGGEAWKKSTKAIERVISVALTIDQPKTAKTIAEEALVAEQTARDHLGLLQELSIIASTTAHGVTKYQPDAGYLRFRSISRMVEEYGKDELLEISEMVKQRIEKASERYDADSPEDLRTRAVSEETSAEEAVELREAASEWETLEYEQSIVDQAFGQYEEHTGTKEAVSA